MSESREYRWANSILSCDVPSISCGIFFFSCTEKSLSFFSFTNPLPHTHTYKIKKQNYNSTNERLDNTTISTCIATALTKFASWTPVTISTTHTLLPFRYWSQMLRNWRCKQFYHEQEHVMRGSTVRRWKLGKCWGGNRYWERMGMMWRTV